MTIDKNKQKRIKINIPRNQGQALIISVIFFVFISLATITGLVSPVVSEYQVANNSIKSKNSFYLSESGAESMFYQIIKALNLGSLEQFVLNGNTTQISFSDPTGEVLSVGDVNSRIRKTQLKFDSGASVSESIYFEHSMLAFEEGVILGDGALVDGAVFSNGPISGNYDLVNNKSSSTIESSAGAIAVKSVGNSGSGTNIQNITGPFPPNFSLTCGKDHGTSDIAQSFTPSSTGQLTGVEFYLRKRNLPGDISVFIVNDAGSGMSSIPGTQQLAEGIITSASVPVDYDWVNVAFISGFQNLPTLQAGVTYWLVLDCVEAPPGGSTAYYDVASNQFQYSGGGYSVGEYNQLGTGYWLATNAIEDVYFDISIEGLGSGGGVIDGMNIGSAVYALANGYAETINNSHIYRDGYYTNLTGNSQIDGSSFPLPAMTPANRITDFTIGEWENIALAGGEEVCVDDLYTIDSAVSLGPKVIPCDLIIAPDGILKISGPIWVQGDLTVQDQGQLSYDPVNPSKSQIIIVHEPDNPYYGGKVNLATSSSYIIDFISYPDVAIFLVSMNAGAAHSVAVDAFNFNSNNAFGQLVVYAPDGSIVVEDNIRAQIMSMTGMRIRAGAGAQIIHLSNSFTLDITKGASSGWKLNSWKEVAN